MNTWHMALFWMGYKNLDHSSLLLLKCHCEACSPFDLSSLDLNFQGSPASLFTPYPPWESACYRRRISGFGVRDSGCKPKSTTDLCRKRSVSKLSVHTVCMYYWKFQVGNTLFFRVGPSRQTRSNRTDATERFSTHPPCYIVIFSVKISTSFPDR